MRVITPQRRHLTALAVLVATSLTVGLVVSVWTTTSGSSDPSPSSEVPAPTEPFPGQGGAVTDAGPNPWQMNDPEWAISFLERYCPASPRLTPEMSDEIREAVQACIASRRAAVDDIASPLL